MAGRARASPGRVVNPEGLTRGQGSHGHESNEQSGRSRDS